MSNGAKNNLQPKGALIKVIVICGLFVVGVVVVLSCFSEGELFGSRSVEIDFTIGHGLSIIAFSLILTYALFDSSRKTLIFTASIIAGLAAIYSGIYVGQGLKKQFQSDKEVNRLVISIGRLLEQDAQSKEEANRLAISIEKLLKQDIQSKKEANRLAIFKEQMLKQDIKNKMKDRSFNLLATFDKPEISKIRAFVTKHLMTQKIPIDKIYDKIHKDKELNNGARIILNQFETISLAIQEGYVDEEVLYTMLGFSVPFYYNHLTPYIKGFRKCHREKGDDNADIIFIEFEKLALAWKNGIYLTTREPLPELL